MISASGAAGYLGRLIATDSTPGNEGRIARLACREMADLGFHSVHLDAAGNAVGMLGSGFPTVLVDCHLDTVPLHSVAAWDHDPFAAEVGGGRIYGLGAADMKGSVAAATYGLSRLRNRPAGTGTVVLVCSIAEETMEGAALRGTVERTAPEVVVIGEPSGLAVRRGQRGRGKLALSVTGRGAHVANPAEGINAVEAMAAVLSELVAVQRTQSPPGIAFSCLEIESEPRPSVSMIPHLCRAKVDCRFAAEYDAVAILAQLDAVVGAALPEEAELRREWNVARFETYTGMRFAIPELVPGWDLPADHPAVQAALDGVSRVGIEPRLGTYGFCTNGGMTARELGIPTIGFGVGREREAHTVDEWVSLAELELGVHGYAAIAEALLAAPLAPMLPAARLQ